jgi:hypothetical protein
MVEAEAIGIVEGGDGGGRGDKEFRAMGSGASADAAQTTGDIANVVGVRYMRKVLRSVIR